jgi:hypothetical protein
MSCFLFEKRHIAEIADAFVKAFPGTPMLGKPYSREELAQEMYAMNVDAYLERYEDEEREEIISDEHDDFNLEDFSANYEKIFPLSTVQFYQSLGSLVYNSAEGDIKTRPLFQALETLYNKLRNVYLKNSPEVKATGWGYNKERQNSREFVINGKEYLIHGCISDGVYDDGREHIRRAILEERADFWTIYEKVNKDGILLGKAIADYPTQEEAVDALKQLVTAEEDSALSPSA